MCNYRMVYGQVLIKMICNQLIYIHLHTHSKQHVRWSRVCDIQLLPDLTIQIEEKNCTNRFHLILSQLTQSYIILRDYSPRSSKRVQSKSDIGFTYSFASVKTTRVFRNPRQKLFHAGKSHTVRYGLGQIYNILTCVFTPI